MASRLMTIGDNPLDAIVPAAATQAVIQGMGKRAVVSDRPPERMSLTVSLPSDLVSRLQHLFGVTAGLDLDVFVEQALAAALTAPSAATAASGAARSRPASAAKPAKAAKAKGAKPVGAKAKPKAAAKRSAKAAKRPAGRSR